MKRTHALGMAAAIVLLLVITPAASFGSPLLSPSTPRFGGGEAGAEPSLASPVEDGDQSAAADQRAAEWEWLKGAYEDLQLSHKMLAGGSLTADQTEQLRVATMELGDEFVDRVTAFINDFTEADFESPSAQLEAALGWYVAFSMGIAEEYVFVGGDYSRAIQIYEACLELLPEHEGLEEALSWAREHQYLTPERFTRAASGMTFEQIREVWGPVSLRSIREYDGHPGIVAWFYPTSAEGGKAVVVFRNGVAIGADFDLATDQDDGEWGEVTVVTETRW